jgi:hypothetical protein
MYCVPGRTLNARGRQLLWAKVLVVCSAWCGEVVEDDEQTVS